MKKIIEWFRCIFFGKRDKKTEIIYYKKYFHTTRDFEILDEINKFREKNGLKEVVLSSIASNIANSHIPFLKQRVYNVETFKIYGHHYADSRSTQLLLQCGGERTGENLAYGYTNAKSVMNAWDKSKGHRKTVLGDYSCIGICSEDKIVITVYV